MAFLPEKRQSCNEIQSHGLRDTGALIYQISFEEEDRNL